MFIALVRAKHTALQRSAMHTRSKNMSLLTERDTSMPPVYKPAAPPEQTGEPSM